MKIQSYKVEVTITFKSKDLTEVKYGDRTPHGNGQTISNSESSEIINLSAKIGQENSKRIEILKSLVSKDSPELKQDVELKYLE